MSDEAPDSASWYGLVKADAPLEQGDILVKCPIFRPPDSLEFPLNHTVKNKMEVLKESVIVLSQSCDIKPNQKKTTTHVVLCWVTPLSKTNYYKDWHGRLQLSNGQIHGLHLLHECPHSPWDGEQLVVSFRTVWTLPISFLTSYANYHGERIRLLSPYREQLSHRFGHFFSRVATPVDLPRIEMPDKERRTVAYIENADQDTRNRILNHFTDQPSANSHPIDGPHRDHSIFDRILNKFGLKRL
jgi:hypothetical protein